MIKNASGALLILLVLLCGALIFDVFRDTQEVPYEEGIEFGHTIEIVEPSSESAIESPLVVLGRADQSWFGGDDTVVLVLTGGGGMEIARASAERIGDFVNGKAPLRVEIFFVVDAETKGFLEIFGGDREEAATSTRHIRIPLTFLTSKGTEAPSTPAPTTESCRPTGCSGTICARESVVTTCEFLPEYACYRDAICEELPSGECGWRETDELAQCLTETKENVN